MPSTFYNKYIFSSSTIEGSEIVAFSKPFSMPFKTADILFLWSVNEAYCFVNPPRDIEEELNALKPKNINLTSQAKDCKKESKKVCFTSSGCDIDVNLQSQSVKKNKQILYYENDRENALLYAAIFADPGIYECQIKRLMKRAAGLADLYRAKSESLAPRGCSSNLESDLDAYASITRSINSSIDLRSVAIMANELGRRNSQLSCKLF